MSDCRLHRDRNMCDLGPPANDRTVTSNREDLQLVINTASVPNTTHDNNSPNFNMDKDSCLLRT